MKKSACERLMISAICLILIIVAAFSFGCTMTPAKPDAVTFDQAMVPEYDGTKVIEINGDVPFFSEEELAYDGVWYQLSDLDGLGRCQTADAVIGKELYPEEEREDDLSSVTPAGWDQIMAPDGEFLWNRGHLLAFAMTGINADPRNLTALTRETNQETMLGWEVMVLQAADHGYHVRYRVTPVYDGDNLIPKGLLMEAYTLDGQGTAYDATFCRFIYNVQDGVEINYADGSVVFTEGGEIE